MQRYNENDDQVFVFYFKDRAVYSLNVTGAFADGIIRPSENLLTAATRAYRNTEQNINSLWSDETKACFKRCATAVLSWLDSV